eukprot:EG_transcript_13497
MWASPAPRLPPTRAGGTATPAWPSAAPGGDAVFDAQDPLLRGSWEEELIVVPPDHRPNGRAATEQSAPTGTVRLAAAGHGPSALRLRVCTWNVAELRGKDMSDADLQRWAGIGEGRSPVEVLVVGLQEVDMRLKAMLKDTNRAGAWDARLTALARQAGMEPVATQQMGGLWLFICVHRSIHHVFDSVEVTTCPTGFLGLLGNKGGVLCRFRLDDKWYCFINSHLAAHQEQVERRNRDYHAIKHRATFRTAPRTVLAHDFVFWFGDLNYRIDLRHDQLAELLSGEDYRGLLHSDQLKGQMTAGAAFQAFQEAGIGWTPTYKFQGDMYCPKRRPAYCDRVLWCEAALLRHRAHCPRRPCAQCTGLAQVECAVYDSLREIDYSDHKPVVAEFVIRDALTV